MPKCTALLLSCGLVVVSSDPNTHFICISHIICKSHTHIICVVPALVIQASTASGRRVIFSAPNFRDAHRWKAGEKLALPKRVCLQTRTDTPFSAASLYLRIHLLQTVSCPADLTHPLKPNPCPPPPPPPPPSLSNAHAFTGVAFLTSAARTPQPIREVRWPHLPDAPSLRFNDDSPVLELQALIQGHLRNNA